MAKQVEPASAEGTAAGATGYGPSGGTEDSQEVVPFVSQVPGTPVHFPAFHGRTVSWVAVTLITAAFLAGGLALVFGPIWWLFWVALAACAVGGLLAVSAGILDDWY
jgi:hypothetical protein